MLHDPVIRPEASDKKIRTSDDFELCYLRHQYFRRVKYNPTVEEMQPYMKIVEHLTKNTFFTYFNLFKSVGMYHDDVLNIGRVHLVSFLGLYALDKVKDKEKEWIVKFIIKNKKDPEEKDYDQKNKANFTMFFKQRMEDLVRVCRQKARNIKGQPSEEYVIFCGKNRPPKYHKKLLKDYEELEYKKMDFPTFKSIRKKANVNSDATIFEFSGFWYVAIALEQKNLDIDDIIGSDSNPYHNEHNMQPDELYVSLPINGQSWTSNIDGHPMNKVEKESEHFQKVFYKKCDYRKRVILQTFIAKNKNMVHYKEEVKTARKLLMSLGGWIR
jgi:hypothetical protein